MNFLSFFRNHISDPWRYLWLVRLFQYLIIFIAVISIGAFILNTYSIISTDSENARYFISSMVQAQAAIVSLVVTLTLIAIQMTATSYTPRVIDVIKKNPDMWFLLTIYIEAISIGFITLKIISNPVEPFLVSLVLMWGLFSFVILFPYMLNTIELLRPDAVVNCLVDEINSKNILENIWQDDAMQPVFDVIHTSINRYDIPTTRTGLTAMSKRILYIYTIIDGEGRIDEAEIIANHLFSHIRRSMSIAVNNNDEGMIKEIISVLGNFCSKTNDMGLETVTLNTISEIGSHGINLIDEKLENASITVVFTLNMFGKELIRKSSDDTILWVIDVLGSIGTHASDKDLVETTLWIIRTLTEFNSKSKFSGMGNITDRVLANLQKIQLHVNYMASSKPAEAIETAFYNIDPINFPKK